MNKIDGLKSVLSNLEKNELRVGNFIVRNDVREYLIELIKEKLDQPKKLMGPNLEEVLGAAGFFKKKEWVDLTEEETTELIQKWAGELVFEVTQALKEKNS